MNWVSEIKEKRWLRGLTAGGCTNFKVLPNGSEPMRYRTSGTSGTVPPIFYHLGFVLAKSPISYQFG